MLKTQNAAAAKIWISYSPPGWNFHHFLAPCWPFLKHVGPMKHCKKWSSFCAHKVNN